MPSRSKVPEATASAGERRDGAYGAAIGIAGIRHVEEPESGHDLFHAPSRPVINRVDEIASAASIVMGQTDAGLPVIVGRGIGYTVDEDAAIADRLARLLLDRDLAARMDAAGRAWVEERRRWDTQAERLASLLRP